MQVALVRLRVIWPSERRSFDGKPTSRDQSLHTRYLSAQPEKDSENVAPSSPRARLPFSSFGRSGSLVLFSRAAGGEDAEFARARGVASLRGALASIWRIRWRVRANVWSTSSSVCWLPSSSPKRILMIFSSSGVRVFNSDAVCSFQP